MGSKAKATSDAPAVGSGGGDSATPLKAPTPEIGDRVMILAPEAVPGLTHLCAYRADVTAVHPDAPTTVNVRVLDTGTELVGVPYMPKAEALKRQRGNTWWGTAT